MVAREEQVTTPLRDLHAGNIGIEYLSDKGMQVLCFPFATLKIAMDKWRKSNCWD